MENSILAQLPIELQLEVLDRVNFGDLLNCSLVCRHIAEIANELIVKKGCFRILYPFPGEEVIANLTRGYRNLSMLDQQFIYEPQKLQSILESLMGNQRVKLKEIHLHMMEEINGPEKIGEFFKFLSKNPQLQIVSLSSFYELTLNELIEKIKSILPHVRVNILKAFEGDSNTDLIVPHNLKGLKNYSQMNEIQMLNTLKKYPNLKSLRYCLKSNNNENDVIQTMKNLQINEISLEKLSLSEIDCLNPKSPSLTVFKNLKKLTLHFGSDSEEDTSEKFKFTQQLYKNNFQTLKSLSLEISGCNYIFNLLPSKDITLCLEDMTFDLSFSTIVEEEALKFVKVFVNQQLPSLKRLYIENLTIDDEMINLLTEAENLEKLVLVTCDIHFETVWPCFTKLKILDLTDSTISYCSLQGFLGNYRIQKTLESLSLERIHPTSIGKKQLKVSIPYSFQSLKKLNLLFCRMKVNFLSKFEAPNLEKLNYDFHDLELPLSPVLHFTNLKVLCLGNHNDYSEISKFLSTLDNLEIFEIGIETYMLISVLESLMIYGRNIILARIVSNGLTDVINCKEIGFSLENTIKDFIKNWPEFSLELYKDREKFIKFSSRKKTIIVHTFEQAYREHSQFYENYLCNLWE